MQTSTERLNNAATLENAKKWDNETDQFVFCLDLLELCLNIDGEDYCDRQVNKLEAHFDRTLWDLTERDV